jgi:flagellar assembly factor FliW
LKIASGKVTCESQALFPEVFDCCFPRGIIGFPNSTLFKVDASQEFFPFLKLKSLQEPNLEFALLDPWLVCESYRVEIPDEDLQLLQTNDPSDIIIYSIVTLHQKGGAISLNMVAPVVINARLGLAYQIILEDQTLPIRHYVKFSG